MTKQLDRIEQLGKDILHRIETDVTNQALIEEIRSLLKTSPPPIPEPPAGGSLFGRTETRWVQIVVSRNLKIPRVKNGNIQYNKQGGMRFSMPPVGQRRKFRVGNRVKVFKPHIQGDGTRLYEVVKYPGNFLMDRDILRI